MKSNTFDYFYNLKYYDILSIMLHVIHKINIYILKKPFINIFCCFVLDFTL